MYNRVRFSTVVAGFIGAMAIGAVSGCAQISGLDDYSKGNGGGEDSETGSSTEIPMVCNEGCMDAMRGNGACDVACKNLPCGFDDGDCDNEHCADDCLINDINDGVCNAPCNVDVCDFDGGDCGTSPVHGCVPGCDADMIGDGECNYQCLGEGCGDDGGDCDDVVECSPGCGNVMLGNGVCNEICNNVECFMDNGDCGGGQGCDPGATSCLADCVPCALESTCIAAVEICDANELCTGLRLCVKECDAKPTEIGKQICVNDCYATHPDGVVDYEKLMECLYCHACPVSCESSFGDFCAIVSD